GEETWGGGGGVRGGGGGGRGEGARGVLVGERRDRLVHRREQAPRVEPVLREAGTHDGRALVERDQVAEDVARGQHLVLDLLRLLGAGHRTRHHGIGGPASAALHLDDAGEGARPPGGLVVGHPRPPADRPRRRGQGRG